MSCERVDVIHVELILFSVRVGATVFKVVLHQTDAVFASGTDAVDRFWWLLRCLVDRFQYHAFDGVGPVERLIDCIAALSVALRYVVVIVIHDKHCYICKITVW